MKLPNKLTLILCSIASLILAFGLGRVTSPSPEPTLSLEKQHEVAVTEKTKIDLVRNEKVTEIKKVSKDGTTVSKTTTERQVKDNTVIEYQMLEKEVVVTKLVTAPLKKNKIKVGVNPFDYTNEFSLGYERRFYNSPLFYGAEYTRAKDKNLFMGTLSLEF